MVPTDEKEILRDTFTVHMILMMLLPFAFGYEHH